MIENMEKETRKTITSITTEDKMTEENMIKKPYEIEPPRLIKMLIYGPPGLGKSTVALSAPSPLLFDFDAGIHRVLAKHWKDTVQVRSWMDVIAVLDAKHGDLSDHKTFILDTVSKLLDFMTAYIVKNNLKGDVKKDGNLTLNGYGTRKSMFQQFVARVGMMGKHLIFLAQEEEREDEIRPKAGGSSGPDLLEQLDLVGHMEAKGNGRVISFEPNEKYYGKNSCGLPAEMELPDPEKTANNFMVTVFDKYNENANASIEIAKEYNILMETVGNDIDEIHDADEANDFVAKIDGYTHIWDSKLQASKAMKKKAAALNLVLDVENRVYKNPTNDQVERDKGKGTKAQNKKTTPKNKKTSTKKASTKKTASNPGKKPQEKSKQDEFDELCKAAKKNPNKDTMGAVDVFWNANEEIRNEANSDILIDLQHDIHDKDGK